jgi:hypothetical protein
MGRSRATHAGRALTEKQDRFVRLIAQGVSNREACRIVGINRRTGTRWRLGRTIRNTAGQAVHYPPVSIQTPRSRHPRYLSLDERMAISDLRRAKLTIRAIARELGRSPATISRGAPAQRRRPRPIPASWCGPGRDGTDRASAGPAGDGGRRAARGGRGPAGQTVEPGAGRARTARTVPKSAGPDAVYRVDLPGDLRPRGAGDPSSQASPSPASPPGPRPGTTRSALRDDDDRRPAGRGFRPGSGRALGG